MKKIKGLFAVVAGVLLAPEFRPFEVKLARAVAAAVALYFGIHYGEQA